MAVDLRLAALRKEFESPDGHAVVAVDDVALEIGKGDLVTLLGPSGCGKTTLLRLIAGFEEPTSGDIYFGDKRVNDLAPNARDTAMVFQSYAIFPHLSVFENVAFGLRLRHMPRAEVREKVNRVLEQVDLTATAKRAPSQLSGGQQQRVALARCIVMEPSLLLFDEPLSNLDAKLREQMRVDIRELQQRLGITSVYVTHDQVEAMAMSDVVVVMNKGRVEQVGSPRQVYARPANHFVADFIGKANFVPGRLVAGGVEVAGVRLPLVEPPDLPVGSEVVLVLRPEAILVDALVPEGSGGDGVSRGGTRRTGTSRGGTSLEGPSPAGPALAGSGFARPGFDGPGFDGPGFDGPGFDGTVIRAMFLGTQAEYLVDVPDVGELVVEVPNPAEVGLRSVGDRVRLVPTPAALHALPLLP